MAAVRFTLCENNTFLFHGKYFLFWPYTCDFQAFPLFRQRRPDLDDTFWSDLQAAKTHQYTLYDTTRTRCKIRVGTTLGFSDHAQGWIEVGHIGIFEEMIGFVAIPQPCIQ